MGKKKLDHLCDGDVVVADVKIGGILAPIVRGLVGLKLCRVTPDLRLYWSYDAAMEDFNGVGRYGIIK